MLDRDWRGIFQPSVHVLEIVVRGTLVYLTLFIFMRLTLRRVGGSFGLADILMVALVAAAVQNALARDHTAITDGLILVMTITFWSYTLDWLGHRFPRFQRFYHPPALLLIKNGRLIRRNMRQELITENELMARLRRHGITHFDEIKEAYMEGDGNITVVPISRKKRSRRP